MTHKKNTMIVLSGKPVTQFPFEDVTQVVDLSYYQGPLLSVFSNAKKEIVLFDWSDCDDTYNRWLVFMVDVRIFKSYIDGQISHLMMIMLCQPHSIHSVDIDNDLNFHNIVHLEYKQVPSSYLPASDVMHCPSEMGTDGVKRLEDFLYTLTS